MSSDTGKQDVWTVRDIVAWTSKRFLAAGVETPLLDTQLLLGEVLGLSKVELYVHYDRPLGSEERTAMRAFVQRRLAGEPVAYLLKRKYWHTLDLFVDRNVLIPRPETETLLDFVLSAWDSVVAKPRVIVDLCTGSGCLAIALAKHFPDAKVIGIDVSLPALEVAKTNRVRNHVENVEFRLGDIFDAELLKSIVDECGTIDILVSNPPYVAEHEWEKCAVDVREFEPRVALVSGENGLAHGHAIAKACCPELLSANATFVMELGIGAPSEQIRVLNAGAALPCFSFHVPLWEIPRGKWFALRDLENRERFLCRVSGLSERSLEVVCDGDPDVVES
jgi:release factor glutamine methyltransferase